MKPLTKEDIIVSIISGIATISILILCIPVFLFRQLLNIFNGLKIICDLFWYEFKIHKHIK